MTETNQLKIFCEQNVQLLRARVTGVNNKFEQRLQEVSDRFQKLEQSKERRHEFQEVKRLEGRVKGVEQRVIQFTRDYELKVQ